MVTPGATVTVQTGPASPCRRARPATTTTSTSGLGQRHHVLDDHADEGDDHDDDGVELHAPRHEEQRRLHGTERHEHADASPGTLARATPRARDPRHETARQTVRPSSRSFASRRCVRGCPGLRWPELGLTMRHDSSTATKSLRRNLLELIDLGVGPATCRPFLGSTSCCRCRPGSDRRSSSS